MLYPYSKIVITQVPTAEIPERNKIFYIDFLVDFEINENITNLTNTAKVTMPKKVDVVILKSAKEITNMTTSVIDSITPYLDKKLFRYGDKIQIYASYLDLQVPESFKANLLFDGYITKVSNETPLTIEADDNMYILKKTPCPNFTWNTKLPYIEGKKQGPLESLINYLFETSTYKGKTLKEIGLKFVGDNTNTDIGEWSLSSSNTIAQFLEELKSKCKFTIFFNGKDLYCGLIVFNSKLKQPDTNKELNFHFQKNIISSNLDFKLKEDTLVKVVAVGIFNKELTSATTGKKSNKEVRVEEIVGDFDGEIRTVHFLGEFTDAYYEAGVTDKMRSKKLREKALALLPKFKMDKAEGSFVTFGEPLVYPGYVITLQDDNLNKVISGVTDNATYLVRGVKRSGGINGYRQEIEIDYRFDTLSSDEIQNYNDNKGIFKNEDINK